MRMIFDKISLDRIDMEGTIDRIADALAESPTHSFHIVTPNAQFVQIARSDSRFATIVQRADLSVADGVPLLWASRLLGTPLPGRVNGTDLMVRLAAEAAQRGWRTYFFGGRPGAAESAAAVLRATHPALRIAGVDCPAIDFMLDARLDFLAAERIRKAAPHILFVALGAPKQEIWISEHRDLPVGVMLGVGGSFELVAGITRRAPACFQRSGCEWFWRLAMEPKRMWKRYLVGNSLFLSILLRLCIQKIFSFEHQPAGVAE